MQLFNFDNNGGDVVGCVGNVDEGSRQRRDRSSGQQLQYRRMRRGSSRGVLQARTTTTTIQFDDVAVNGEIDNRLAAPAQARELRSRRHRRISFEPRCVADESGRPASRLAEAESRLAASAKNDDRVISTMPNRPDSSSSSSGTLESHHSSRAGSYCSRLYGHQQQQTGPNSHSACFSTTNPQTRSPNPNIENTSDNKTKNANTIKNRCTENDNHLKTTTTVAAPTLLLTTSPPLIISSSFSTRQCIWSDRKTTTEWPNLSFWSSCPKFSSNANVSSKRAQARPAMVTSNAYCFLLTLVILLSGNGLFLRTLTSASASAAAGSGGGGGGHQASFKYAAPEFCHWVQASPESLLVSVTCSLATLQENSSWTGVQNDGTVSLRVQCADGIYIQSALANNSMDHLHQLRELDIEFCKLDSVPARAFHGLTELRNLSLRTHNDDWPGSLTLAVRANAFARLRLLERLDLSQNGIWTFPERIFCPLVNLKTLNLTRNRLQDIKNLGFSDAASAPPASVEALAVTAPRDDHRHRSSKSTNGEDEQTAPIELHASSSNDGDVADCRLELTVLDLSHNDIQLVPSDAFNALRRLREIHLQDNQVSTVSERALAGMHSLHVLNLSGNDLITLPPELFANTSELMELHLSNNSLSILAPGLFAGLQQLLVLDMSHNEVSDAWVNAATFEELIRLVVLNLNHNRLTRVDAHLFHNLYSLQILELAHNQIETVAEHAFASMYNLHTLVLGHNRLTHIDAHTFNGLYVLSLLSVDNNRVDNVHADAFRNCSHLQDLHLNENSLFSVPDAIRHLPFLKTLDLGDNHINSIRNASYRGLQQLHGLRLINNNIGNLSKGAFADMPALRILNLARNAIQAVEPATFDRNQNLHALRLDANFLTDVNGLFTNLPSLQWLNISANQLTWFDYALVPLGLQWLDVHANQIASLGNYFELESKLQMQTMDASSNKITELGASAIPDGIQLLFLNDNKIATIQPYTFFKKHNLTRVDLFGNRLQSMDLNAVRLSEVPDDGRPVPEFYLGGNNFQCDCKMEWLQRINSLAQLRQHPRIMDLESIYCRLLHHHGQERAFVPLVEVQPAQFLCVYTAHCFALCHCCEFDACDCEMTCPPNCTCYHDQSWSANIVSCARRNYSQMPDRIPMDATEVYLDGNRIWSLSSHSFIGRKNMVVLFLNDSAIHVINNRTFNGLRALEVLHLEDNSLIELRGFEFERLENLRELYLHNNRLTFIHNATFLPLRSLEILRLDGNRLVDFAVWNNIVNPLLVLLTLGRNPWSCNCRFMEEYQAWLSTAGMRELIRDARVIQCASSNGSSVSETSGGSTGNGIPMMDFNLSLCDNRTTANTVVQPKLSEDYLPVLVITLSIFALIMLTVLLVFVFRHEMRVKLYSRYGLRLCHKSDACGDDGKLFDAFVSYSSKDESFVMQVLAPELECGDPAYKLCLHYRDFPVGAYVGDTIVEAIESSSRTILLLSENFIKSEWCRFEFKSAHHQVLKDRKKRLVVILLGEVAQRDLDPDIRLYLKTNTFLQWGDKLFWEKLKFALPDVRHRNKHRDNSTRSVAIHI